MIKNAKLKNFAKHANAAMPRTWPSDKVKHCVTAGYCVMKSSEPSPNSRCRNADLALYSRWIARGSHDIWTNRQNLRNLRSTLELFFWTDRISLPALLVHHRPEASCTCRRLPVWTVLFVLTDELTSTRPRTNTSTKIHPVPVEIQTSLSHGSFSFITDCSCPWAWDAPGHRRLWRPRPRCWPQWQESTSALLCTPNTWNNIMSITSLYVLLSQRPATILAFTFAPSKPTPFFRVDSGNAWSKPNLDNMDDISCLLSTFHQALWQASLAKLRHALQTACRGHMFKNCLRPCENLRKLHFQSFSRPK